MYCERAEHLKQKGIDTEIYCHCSDDVDFECTALDMLKATIEHLAGCCEKGFPKDVATTPPVVSKKLSEIRYNIKQIVACIEHWESKDQGLFSWVDDGMFAFIKDVDFCYYLHAGWVPDWNKSERAQPMNTFLRQWITEQNIATVLKVTEEWKNNI